MRTRLTDGMKNAMKSGEKRKVSTLRLIMAAIKDRDIQARTAGDERVSDDDILGILSKMIKQREESARIYEESNRQELADQEREEMEVIRTFLPRQMDEAEIKQACEKVISDVGGESLRDMGKCMNALKQEYPGKLDVSQASKFIKQLLS